MLKKKKTNSQKTIERITQNCISEIGLHRIYFLHRRKDKTAIVKSKNVLIPTTLDRLNDCLAIQEPKIIVVSSYLLNIKSLEKLLSQTDTQHHIFYAIYYDKQVLLKST